MLIGLRKHGTKINPSSLYIAPQYIKRGVLDDPIMLSQIESLRPSSVFIQLGECTGKIGFI